MTRSPEDHEHDRLEYRALLLEVFRAMRAHRGAEATYQEFMQRSIELERWMLEVFGSEGQKRLPDAQEETISRQFRKSTDTLPVNKLLDMMSDRLDRLEDLDVFRVHTDAVVLPTKSRAVQSGDGSGTIEPFREQKRLVQLIHFLQTKGVYTDDLVIIEGTTSESMMRTMPYVLVEIPRLNRQLLVCDEVGEATFVAKEILSRDVFFTEDKESLQAQYPGIIRIVYQNPEQWETDVWKTLTDTSASKPVGPKIDVRDRETVRQLITAQHTPEWWVAAIQDERVKVSAGGEKNYCHYDTVGHSRECNYSHIGVAASR